jgi:glycosyltransferase involved in cell wall biosynthesis
VKARLSRGCSLSSIAIHHWTDPLRFHPRDKHLARRILGFPTDEKLVLNVSAGTSNKNYGQLNAIARNLRAGYQMVKIGGRIPDLKTVIHLPWISHELYPLLFNACDAYVHTSIQEGFGRPLLESIVSGLPVVSMKSQVALEILGDAGTYVESTAPAFEWIKSIELSTVDDFRAGVIERGYHRLPLFEPARAREAYSRVYRQAFGI